MRKFGRIYNLEVETNDGTSLTFSLPVTVEFDVIRNFMSSLNTCQFRLYNLSPEHRRALQKNRMDQANLRFLTFAIGYESEGGLSVGFSGNVQECNSYRQGVDYITDIECQDGAFGVFHGRVEATFPPGTTRRSMIQKLVKTLPGVQLGAIGNSYDDTLSRGNSYSGKTWEILKGLSDGDAFIDKGRVFMLSQNEYLDIGSTTIIDSSSGLLGTPIRQQNNLVLHMILTPEITMCQKVTLKSQTESWMNGDYKVISIHHAGIISSAVAGEATTEIGLMAPLLGVQNSKVKNGILGELIPVKVNQ